MPMAVVLSTWMDVAGCGWPDSCDARPSIFTSCALRNSAPNYVSTANAATSFNVEHVMCTLSFSRSGSLFLGRLPRKK